MLFVKGHFNELGQHLEAEGPGAAGSLYIIVLIYISERDWILVI